MKLHEYQAKQLLAAAGVPIQRGRSAKTPEEAAQAYETVKREAGGGAGFACNIKAQLHAGGRGKAGGIQVAASAVEAAERSKALLGKRLVTKQTGPDGLPVSAVLVDERLSGGIELYLAVTIDRSKAMPAFLASRSGGVDIEEVAAKDADAIVRVPVDIDRGLDTAGEDQLLNALGLTGPAAEAGRRILRSLWTAFLATDASLIELNPLVLAPDGRVLPLDAKMTVDDNALFRHPDLAALRDESQEHPLELQAGRIGISYVGLDGTIGCLVNGAGLAMATNDIIKLCGGTPANFLDVGGGANVEQVTQAFQIILADARVKAVLVNIFGGIMRCDWIAQGLLNATQQLQVKVPIVVRLQGTNVEEGRRLLKDAHRLNLISCDELEDAARKVVELARS